MPGCKLGVSVFARELSLQQSSQHLQHSMAEVSAHDFLRQQGATFVCFHPCSEQLVLGIGCSEQPLVLPACVAYRRKPAEKLKPADQHQVRSPPDESHQQLQTQHPAWPHQQAYEALSQVQRLLHLPAPPKPPSLQQQQQQQQQSSTDSFPAAKAGVVSQQEVAEGSDGFIWLDDKQQEKLQQQRQQQRQQAQQQQQAPSNDQQQPQQQQAAKLAPLPCFAGGQVPALWPPEDYEAHWLMTPDNHIAGIDTTPQHLLLDRFEAVWGWAVQQLGLPLARCRHMSAVLAVPIAMTAAEVRFLADVLLGRLGFAALVVHLEPIAASFGNGTTSACVVNVGSSSCSVCCIDDAVVLPPGDSRYSLPVGLADIAGALTGWMSCYSHWPRQLQQHGLGGGLSSSSTRCGGGSSGGGDGAAGPGDEDYPAAVAGGGNNGSSRSSSSRKPAAAGGSGLMSPAGVYNMLLLEDLVLQQCYYPKESYQPGMLGMPMLEHQPPAVVPLRASGRPTTNFSVSLGSWAAAASMALFFPGLAPPPPLPAASAPPPPTAQTGFKLVGLVGHQNPGGGAGQNPGALASPVKQEEGGGVSTVPAAAAAAAEPNDSGAAAAAAAAAPEAEPPTAWWMYQRYHSRTLELPAAEALHMQVQLKSRIEAGDTAPPPDGLYLLPLDLTEQPAVTGAAPPPAAAAGGGAGPAASGRAASGGAAAAAAQPANSTGGSSGIGDGGGIPSPTPQPQSQQQDAKAGVSAAAAAGSAAGSPVAAAGGAGGGPGGGNAAAGAAVGQVDSNTPAIGLDEAVFRSITAASAGRPELMSRLAAGLLLIGPGGGLRGLASMLERRVGQRFTAARQPQVVFTLEPRAEAAQVTWKGAALLAALDAGRENWLPRHQWVDGGLVLPGPAVVSGKQPATATAAAGGAAGKKGAAAAGGGGGGASGAGTGSNCTAAAGRHTKLFYYCRAEQGVL